MSKETRIVRPFNLDAKLDRCLNGVRMWFGEGSCEPGGRIVVEDPEEYMRSGTRLAWAEDKPSFVAFRNLLVHGLADQRIEPAMASLIVTAYTKYLRITDILVDHPVSQIDTLERNSFFHSADRPRALQASTHGATITAYLLLNRDIERKPLRPWRMGTWLAKVAFQIQLDTAHRLFRPTPMNAETRQEFGLQKNCVRYFHIGDHEPLRPFSDSPPPIFYVDADLLARLDRASGTASGVALQVQFACDLISGVILEVARKRAGGSDLDWSEIRDSLFGRIVALAAGRGASIQKREEAIRLSQDDPALLLAHVESVLKLRPTLAKSLLEDQ